MRAVLLLFAAASVLAPLRAGAGSLDGGWCVDLLRFKGQREQFAELFTLWTANDEDIRAVISRRVVKVHCRSSAFLEYLPEYIGSFLHLCRSIHSSTLAQPAPARSGVRTDAAATYEKDGA